MDHASPEENDDYASDSDGLEEHDTKEESSQTSPASTNNSTAKTASSVKPATNFQKRRRVTRACDECRRKKIKCDGKQPCTHCSAYSYECTYDQPSNRRRNPAPQYVESLEHRAHKAETLLKMMFPSLDLNDPSIDAAVAQGWIPGLTHRGAANVVQEPSMMTPTSPSATTEGSPDMNLESMFRAVAQIDMDETGHWDYHGHSSGLSFVKRMREQLGDLMGPDTSATPFVKSRPVHHVIDSPKSIPDSPYSEFTSPSNDLPDKDMAKRICACAVNDAAALLRIVHQTSFWTSFERVYSIPQDQYTNEEHVFLPLLYSAMALGSLFGRNDQGLADREGYETVIAQGFAYFKAARHMMDIADCRDLPHIQAVVFMILFLQSTAKLSQCYAYVGIALRSAIRLGLHRASAGKFNPIEAETRKRVFWVIRKLDVYVGAMIGLPLTLSDEDIDQEYPLEIDDEYITKDAIIPQPEGVVSLMTAFNLHTNLVKILAKIVKKVYPINVENPLGVGDKSYSVPYSTILEIENDLQMWISSLPPIFQPCEAPMNYVRVQQLLRMSYAHAQVMLYRPFLHFVANEKRAKLADQRAYACAMTYLQLSRNIIHIQTQMKQKGLLNGAYWFAQYTSFFSILSLVYFAAENPENITSQELMKDAIEGKNVLASLASRSMAADRCTATLNVIFQKLPAWMREGQQNPVISRKRPHDANLQASQLASTQASRSHPEMTFQAQAAEFQESRRAATFPNLNQAPTSGTASPYSKQWSQANSPFTGTTSAGPYDSEAYSTLNQNSLQPSIDGVMPQYSTPQAAPFATPALTDLSSMMFPGADEPFIYPSQPLTTFENQQYRRGNDILNNSNNRSDSHGGSHQSQQIQVERPFSSMVDESKANALPRGDEDIETQFFALPPYIQQQQRQHQHQRQQQMSEGMQRQHGINLNPAMSFHDGRAGGVTQAMQMPTDTWVGQQHMLPPHDMGSTSIPDLFGANEWNPLAMHGTNFAT